MTGAGATGATLGPGVSHEELALATRNHGMPLEAMQWPVTPLGLHYLLVHYDIPVVEPASWRVVVGGEVEHPRSWSLAELRARPAHTVTVTMECAGNGRSFLDPRPVSQPWGLEAVGTARWTGVPLRDVLEEAAPRPGAVAVVFRGLDRGVEGGVEQSYERSLDLGEAGRDDVLLAYEMNGAPLLPQHGFPLRAVVPGWYGMTNVKWLAALTVIDAPFTGYQHERAYRLRSDDESPGDPLTRMMPRALMVPPGVPEFLSRRRVLDAGVHVLRGRAWSGWAPVEAVEVSVDGGTTWAPAALDEPADRWAWRGWSFEWRAERPGDVELCCRARDASGGAQPDAAGWNAGGYANNAVQRVGVTVRPAGTGGVAGPP